MEIVNFNLDVEILTSLEARRRFLDNNQRASIRERFAYTYLDKDEEQAIAELDRKIDLIDDLIYIFS